ILREPHQLTNASPYLHKRMLSSLRQLSIGLRRLTERFQRLSSGSVAELRCSAFFQFPRITTNIRNTKSPHCRRWLAPESRGLVPEGRLTLFMATTASQSSTKHRAIRPIAPN